MHCVNGCGTPELDQYTGVDSKTANNEAAEALLELVGGAEAPMEVVSTTAAKGDDISVERARYLQSKQQHSTEHAADSQVKAAASEPPQMSTAEIVTKKQHGKWGCLVPSMEGMVKLGARQDDPKKRLEQTCRNSLGAFAAPALVPTAKSPGTGERHSPPSRSARPAKSAMRQPGPIGDNDTIGSEGSSSASATSGVQPNPTGPTAARLQWQDMNGKGLFTRHVYENEFDLEPEA